MDDLNSRLKSAAKILIVDDRETERITLKKLLSKFPVEIHTAASGQEALSKLIRHSFILVLLDIQMPIMDGIETAKLMRSNRSTENVPIIFLTAYDKDEIQMLQGYKIGAIDYLFKPIRKEILLSKVDTFLRAYSFEKEKEYEKILNELETKNTKLIKAQNEALCMMKEANEARSQAEEARKQIELQSEELIRYTKELEQFAYVATHDLRAPIINLNGLLRIFKKRGYVNSENDIIFSKLESSVFRINNTLNDLIQVVAYRKTLNDEVINIRFESLFSSVLEDIETLIKNKSASVTADFKEVPEIHYIPGHLKSIFQNLITNSLKYSSEERQPVIKVFTQKVNDFILLSVVDNGIGIDISKKDKVFGLFQRLETDIEGKGMGLYLVKSQIESMGGNIDFTSEIGKGTTFNVFLKNLTTN